MTHPADVLVTSEGYRDGDDPRPEHRGRLLMKVWWADGRVTESTAYGYSAAYDVISGDAHPYERWEIMGTAVEPEPLYDGRPYPHFDTFREVGE